MFRRLTLTLCALLACSSAAFAQAHPCDAAPPSSQSIPQNTPHKVVFCSPASDNVEAAVAYVDGVASALMPVTVKAAQSTVSGKVLYETPVFLSTSNRGNHTLTVAAYNRDAAGVSQAGPQSPPFAFAVVAEAPLAVSLSADKASPVVAGTPITLTATAQGGVAPYQFAIRMSMDGGATWDYFRFWSATNVYVVTPPNAGTMLIQAWARSSDWAASGDQPEATSAVLTMVVTPVAPPPVPKPGAPVIVGVTR